MKSDWTITGTGGQAIISEGGSMRCQLTSSKMMLWTARNNLINAQIIGLIKLYTANASVGKFLLRCDNSYNNAYFLSINGSGNKIYNIYRLVNGVSTLLATASSSESITVYTKVRFSVSGNQISVEEYIAGNWNLIQVVTDTFLTAGGYAGIAGGSTTGYYASFDDVQILEQT